MSRVVCEREGSAAAAAEVSSYSCDSSREKRADDRSERGPNSLRAVVRLAWPWRKNETSSASEAAELGG